MHIQCTICSDIVNQAENLYVTKCGHIFHHHCLAQWIERSKSCPQCRNKVTERCMFRLYPTVSEGSREGAAALQARLDDAALELRARQAELARLRDDMAAAAAEASDRDAQLTAAESRALTLECALGVLRQKLAAARDQARDAERLMNENDELHKTMKTMNGLQRVLQATAAEAEETLRGYSDLRTVATFATALKRALCESENKKRSLRTRHQQALRDLALLREQYKQLQAKCLNMERKYDRLHNKRKAEDDARAAKHPRPASPSPSKGSPPPSPTPSKGSPLPAPGKETPSPATPGAAADTEPAKSHDDTGISEDNISFSSMVDRIVQSQSPYLSLQRTGLALCTLRRRQPAPRLQPSDLAALSSSPTSIFRQKTAPPPAAAAPPPDAPYDGLGGRAPLDPFPAVALRPPPRHAPRPSARHKLRPPRPPRAAAGCRDIAAMFRSSQKTDDKT